jgi:hypothetical protein
MRTLVEPNSALVKQYQTFATFSLPFTSARDQGVMLSKNRVRKVQESHPAMFGPRRK